jgi:hypothetical protein
VSCNRLVGCSGRQRLTGSGPAGGAAASEPTTKLRDGSPSLGSRAARFAAGVQKTNRFSAFTLAMVDDYIGGWSAVRDGVRGWHPRACRRPPPPTWQRKVAGLLPAVRHGGCEAAETGRNAQAGQVWTRGAAQAGGVFVVQRVREKRLSPIPGWNNSVL